MWSAVAGNVPPGVSVQYTEPAGGVSRSDLGSWKAVPQRYLLSRRRTQRWVLWGEDFCSRPTV